jgi:hypothetical protein
MNFNDLLGQSHATKLGNLIISQCPTGVLIMGPHGCGKTSYAKIVAEGLGGKGGFYTDIPDGVQGGWSIIKTLEPSKQDWARLVELMDAHPKHCFMVIQENLDRTPRGIQSRCVRVVLRPIPQSELLAYAENILVQSRVVYDSAVLSDIVESCKGDIRVLKSTLGLALVNGGMDLEFQNSMCPSLRSLAVNTYTRLADGYLPEAKESAKLACELFSPTEFSREMLNVYGEAWAQHPLGDRIKFRFPSMSKTTECLVRWTKTKSQSGDPLGALLVEELHRTGTTIEDPRVVEARRQAELERSGEVLRGRPELNLDPQSVANRKNPEVPIYEDKSVPMDPRIREKLRKEAQQATMQSLKQAHMIASSVISTESVGDVNPFGVRMPPPKKIPKGVVLGTAFAKRTKARKLEPPEKWDLVYSEKADKESMRAKVVEAVVSLEGRILSETNLDITAAMSSENKSKFLALVGAL